MLDLFDDDEEFDDGSGTPSERIPLSEAKLKALEAHNLPHPLNAEEEELFARLTQELEARFHHAVDNLILGPYDRAFRFRFASYLVRDQNEDFKNCHDEFGLHPEDLSVLRRALADLKASGREQVEDHTRRRVLTLLAEESVLTPEVFAAVGADLPLMCEVIAERCVSNPAAIDPRDFDSLSEEARFEIAKSVIGQRSSSNVPSSLITGWKIDEPMHRLKLFVQIECSNDLFLLPDTPSEDPTLGLSVLGRKDAISDAVLGAFLSQVRDDELKGKLGSRSFKSEENEVRTTLIAMEIGSPAFWLQLLESDPEFVLSSYPNIDPGYDEILSISLRRLGRDGLWGRKRELRELRPELAERILGEFLEYAPETALRLLRVLDTDALNLPEALPDLLISNTHLVRRGAYTVGDLLSPDPEFLFSGTRARNQEVVTFLARNNPRLFFMYLPAIEEIMGEALPPTLSLVADALLAQSTLSRVEYDRDDRREQGGGWHKREEILATAPLGYFAGVLCRDEYPHRRQFLSAALADDPGDLYRRSPELFAEAVGDVEGLALARLRLLSRGAYAAYGFLSDLSLPLDETQVKDLQCSYRSPRPAMTHPLAHARHSDLSDLEDDDDALEISYRPLPKERRDGALRLCESIASNGLADSTDVADAHLFSKLLASQTNPSERLMAGLRLFSAQTRLALTPILCQLDSENGADLLESLFVLRGGAPFDRDETQFLQFLSGSTFRGFSPRTIEILKEKFLLSKILAHSCIREWDAMRQDIIFGREIAGDHSEVTAELVMNAYRPVGLSLRDVCQILNADRDDDDDWRDYTDHLEWWVHDADWSFPSEGHPLIVSSRGGVSTLPTVGPIEENLSVYADRIEAALRSEGMQSSASHALLSALNAGIDDDTRTVLLSYLFGGSIRSRVVDAMSRCTRSSASPSMYYHSLRSIEETLGVILDDAITDSLPALVATIRGSTGIEKRLRGLLGISDSKDLTDSLRVSAFQHAVRKAFSPWREKIARDISRFTHETGAPLESLKVIFSKARHAYLSRASVGLCTARDDWSWNNKAFLQMSIVEIRSCRIVGNIQLHLFQNERGQRSVLARINPSSKLLENSDPESLASGILGSIELFASQNKLKLYLPEQTWWHELSNRDELVPYLQRFYGKKESVKIQIAEDHFSERIYRVKRPAKKLPS